MYSEGPRCWTKIHKFQIMELHLKSRDIVFRILSNWVSLHIYQIYLIIFLVLYIGPMSSIYIWPGHSNCILRSLYCLVMDISDLTAHASTFCNFSRNISVHIWRITYLVISLSKHNNLAWTELQSYMYIFEHNNITSDNVIVAIIVLRLWWYYCCVRPPKHLFLWSHGPCITIEIVHED